MSDYLKQVWLGARLEPGSRLLPLLLKELGDETEIFSASESALTALLGKSKRAIRALADKRLDDAERLLELCATRNIRLITYFDKHYPARLRRLPNPPALLFLRGSLPDFESSPSVSVVGTREPTEYSAEQTYGITYGLAASGVLTVSGMALGIDGIAAAATLAARGRTVAVLGSGADVIYPKQHASLAEMISETGCILSEYPPGAAPDKWNFPLRNRIIAALGDAVLVTAGSLHSGALITARHASELDIPVFALPGRVDIPDGQGPALLLREGAKLAASADDLLALLSEQYPDRLDPASAPEAPTVPFAEAIRRYRISSKRKATAAQRRARHSDGGTCEEMREEKPRTATELPTLSLVEAAVFEKIPPEGECHPDELADGELSISDVGSALTMLEIYGIIQTTPGGRIRRTV